MIKFWALVYRLTGWYSPFATLAEYNHLESRFNDIEKRYNRKDNDMSFKNHVGIEVGLWQAHNGFVRPYKFNKKFKPRKKK